MSHKAAFAVAMDMCPFAAAAANETRPQATCSSDIRSLLRGTGYPLQYLQHYRYLEPLAVFQQAARRLTGRRRRNGY